MASSLRYQALRELGGSLSAGLAVSMSQGHLTSAAGVNGLPSCHLTPCRSLKVSRVWSSSHDQLSASSGWINSGRFCLSSCLNKTRLLKTPIIGATVEIVASSWIDMLAGLSR